MIIKVLGFLFKKLIGRVPEGTRDKLWDRFRDLMCEAVEAGAKGAAEGLKK